MFSSSNDNALLKHMESHALFEALEENDSQVCNGHIFQIKHPLFTWIRVGPLQKRLSI
jgi:hypothetical protein